MHLSIIAISNSRKHLSIFITNYKHADDSQQIVLLNAKNSQLFMVTYVSKLSNMF
jgi:DNA integrity scanning protein DisA with diadenylate cyclase activity